jgi:hypothetical protein
MTLGSPMATWDAPVISCNERGPWVNNRSLTIVVTNNDESMTRNHSLVSSPYIRGPFNTTVLSHPSA